MNTKEDCTFKIRSVQANRIYQVNNGYVDKDENGIIKKYYLTWRDAVINDSIFSHYMLHHGVRLMKKDHTLDFVIIKFDYSVPKSADSVKSSKPEISPDKLREMYYRDGCEITWNTYDKKTGEVVAFQTILYRMLYRTPGKAKDGSCIFIRDELLNKARKYLTMDLYDKMPDTGAKIVEMSAYSTLITASAMNYIHIPMENILIVKDQKSATELPALAVRVDDEKHCYVQEYEKYKIENVLWDGMGLIDDSIFPEDMEGFIYCRSHFFKSCLFRGNIQQYFKDYYKTEYDTATVTDMFGNVMKVSDVKVIVTDNSIKWLKFKDLMGKTDLKAYRFYKKFMQRDGEQFAIVKTAHKSKYGNLQRSSYQMNNSLPTTDVEVLKRIAQTSVDYYNTMIKSTDAFVDHLRMNKSVYSIDRILVALYEHNTDIQYTSFFKDRKSDILSKFKRKRLMLGKLLQEGDNLTICGNPISLLMMVTGQDYLNEGCFISRRDGIGCYTTRFNDGECLAGFRSPHNSPNNIVYLINKYSEPIQTYFPKLGDNIIIINGIVINQAKAVQDAMFKEIDARKKALKKKKEYYDYDKTIKKKTDEIEFIKQQIRGLEGLTDAESKAQKARLEASLKDKQDDLDDTVRDHVYDITVNGLDDLETQLSEDFEKWSNQLSSDLAKMSDAISDAISGAGENYSDMMAGINYILNNIGGISSGQYFTNQDKSNMKNSNSLDTGYNPGHLKGYAKGTKRVGSNRIAMTNENGREIIVTKDGWITPLEASDMVIPNDITETLIDMAERQQNYAMNGNFKMPELKVKDASGNSVNNVYNTFTVQGDLTRDTLPELNKILDLASSKTQNDIRKNKRRFG